MKWNDADYVKYYKCYLQPLLVSWWFVKYVCTMNDMYVTRQICLNSLWKYFHMCKPFEKWCDAANMTTFIGFPELTIMASYRHDSYANRNCEQADNQTQVQTVLGNNWFHNITTLHFCSANATTFWWQLYHCAVLSHKQTNTYGRRRKDYLQCKVVSPHHSHQGNLREHILMINTQYNFLFILAEIRDNIC